MSRLFRGRGGKKSDLEPGGEIRLVLLLLMLLRVVSLLLLLL